jgi:RNA polymerase sigma-70 factor (ECF subfamily)
MSGFANRQVADEVVARARAGDMAAHEAIFRLFASPVLSLAYRITGSRAAADDMLQETFLEVIGGIRRFRGEAALGTWIRQITVSRCLMHLRSPWWRRVNPGPDDERVLQGAASAEPELLDVERALLQLPATARAIVLLYDVEGYSHQEIARLFGRTEGFSKSQLARARQRLRLLLGAEPAVRSAAACENNRPQLRVVPLPVCEDT